MAVQELDDAKVAVVAERLTAAMVGGAVSLMVDIGHRVGLFEAAAGAGALTSDELAARAGLSERHVREWLGAMVTADLMTFDPRTSRYELAAECALLLTGGGASNLAVTFGMIPMLAKHAAAVAETFRTGGGLPYSVYRPEFTNSMDDEGRRRYDEMLVSTYVPAAAGLAEQLAAGARCADIGCGTGHTTNLLARAYPASTFVGYDLADDAIAAARREAADWGLANASFEVRDVLTMPAQRAFDAVFVFDAIHDQVDPAGVLTRVEQSLVPGGLFFMVDIKASSNVEDNCSSPFGPLLYMVSTFHCMQVSLAGGGAGLGTAWGEQLATSMLKDAGFVDIQVHDLPGDPFNSLYVCKTGGTR